jgi:alkanesulfonate monooxygenase
MLQLAWYCPSEGDGSRLGTRAPERPPTFDYLLRVVRAAERAGAREVLVPTGAVNDSFAPDAPFMESWTTAAALAARTTRIRILVAVNPAPIAAELAAHQAETLWAVAPGRIAINLVAGGGPVDPYGGPPMAHDARYARLRTLAEALRSRFPGPLYLGGASPAATRLAADVCDTYLMWGEPPEQVAERAEAMRALAGRPMRIGLRMHLIARRSEAEARGAAGALLSRAEVGGDRAAEYAAFDSQGQARMNALAADEGDWVAPGLWAGIRRVRGGAGTALVGSYGQVAGWLERYREAGVDLVIGSGYPHLEEVGRVARRVWPRLRVAVPA